MNHNRRPTAPGKILLEMYLKPRGIKLNEFAPAINLSDKQLSLIINGHARVTPLIAVKIGKALNTSSELWMNLQHAVDVWEARKALGNWKPAKVFSAEARV